jgi:hypothetical protein
MDREPHRGKNKPENQGQRVQKSPVRRVLEMVQRVSEAIESGGISVLKTENRGKKAPEAYTPG